MTTREPRDHGVSIDTVDSLRAAIAARDARIEELEGERDETKAVRDRACAAEVRALAATEDFCRRESLTHIRRDDLADMKSAIARLTAERDAAVARAERAEEPTLDNSPLIPAEITRIKRTVEADVVRWLEREWRDRAPPPYRKLIENLRSGAWRTDEVGAHLPSESKKGGGE